jgi:transposase
MWHSRAVLRRVSRRVTARTASYEEGGQLLALVGEKADEAACQVIAVEARHTSQRCTACSHTEAGNRTIQAVFWCLSCGHEDHADLNAAKNILRAWPAQRESAKQAD